MNQILLSILEEEKRLNRKLVKLANEGTFEFLRSNQEQVDLLYKMENKLNFLGVKYDLVKTKRRVILVLNELVKENAEA